MSANHGDDGDKVPNFLLDNIPILDETSLATQSPTSSIRSRNGVYNSGLPYPSMSYMKKRPYRTNSGAGTPVYTNIHQLRYPSGKFPANSKPSLTVSTDHPDKRDRSFSASRTHHKNYQYESTPTLGVKHLDSPLGTSKSGTPRSNGSISGNSSKKLNFGSKFSTKDSLGSTDDNSSSSSSSINSTSINVIHASSGSHFASRNGIVFSKTPSSDNLGMSRQQKVLHESPSSFSDTNKTLKEQHRISTLGLGIKIPKSPERNNHSNELTLKTPESMIFENSPIKNPEDFPLVNFSSRRSNTSYKNSPHSAIRMDTSEEKAAPKSPISVHSHSLDDLFNDVVENVDDEQDSKMVKLENDSDEEERIKQALGINEQEMDEEIDQKLQETSKKVHEKENQDIRPIVTEIPNSPKKSEQNESLDENNYVGKEDEEDADNLPTQNETLSFNNILNSLDFNEEYSNTTSERKVERSFSFNEKIMSMAEIDISRFSDDEEESYKDAIEKHVYHLNNEKVSGFKVPVDEDQDSLRIDDIMNNNFDSLLNLSSQSLDQPMVLKHSLRSTEGFNKTSATEDLQNDKNDSEEESNYHSATEPENRMSINSRVSLMSSNKADAELENKIKSLLLIKKHPILKLFTENNPSEVSMSPEESKSQQTSGELSNDTSKLFNNKTDLYLDRFPNFSMSSDLISPPRSPTKNFISSASSTPLHLQLKNNDPLLPTKHENIVLGHERTSIDAIVETPELEFYKTTENEKNEKNIPSSVDNVKKEPMDISSNNATTESTVSNNDKQITEEPLPISPKKLSFKTLNNSRTIIDWNVTDPTEWTMDRVVKWLQLYKFNSSWVETFSKYNVCHQKFLELTNDDQFSKFNTYLKLNNEYLDFGSSDFPGQMEGTKPSDINNLGSSGSAISNKTDYTGFLSSSSKFRFLLKRTIEEENGNSDLANFKETPVNPVNCTNNQTKGFNNNLFGFADDLNLLAKNKRVNEDFNRHGRSNSDDIINRYIGNDDKFSAMNDKGHTFSLGANTKPALFVSKSTGTINQTFAYNRSNHATSNGSNASSATSATFSTLGSSASTEPLSTVTHHSSGKSTGKRLSYIKRPFSVIESTKNKTMGGSNSKESPLSPYSALFKRSSRQHDFQGPSFVSPTNSAFPPGISSDSDGARSVGPDNIASVMSANETSSSSGFHDHSARSEPSEKKSGFLMKTFLKKDKNKPEFKHYAGRKNSEGTSPVSPVSTTSFEANRRHSKELVGHIQLTDREFPKPLSTKAKHYLLVTKDNVAFVPIAEEKLNTVKKFKENIAQALNLPINDLQRLTFHMTDYDSEYGAALSDSTIDSLIMFSFINYEVKFYVHYDSPVPVDLTHSSTQSTRSTKSSDTASFELAADNRVAYPATPSSLINDGSHKGAVTRKGEEVDYLNFKESDAGNANYNPLSPGSSGYNTNSTTRPLAALNDTNKPSFSVIRPETNKREINFDKKRESPFVKTKVDLVPQRPAPAPPKGGLQRSASVSKRISSSPLLNKDANVESFAPATIIEHDEGNKSTTLSRGSVGGTDTLRRSGTLLRRTSIRQSLDSRSSRISNRKSAVWAGTDMSTSKFEENKISFEGVPSLEEESEEIEDSDEDFWAMAPKPKIEDARLAKDADTSVENKADSDAISVDAETLTSTKDDATESLAESVAESMSSKEKRLNDLDSVYSGPSTTGTFDDKESCVSTAPTSTSKTAGAEDSQTSRKSSATSINQVKSEKDKWVVRPSTDIVYDNLEHFFPNTDLDKPIIYEVDTPPVSPLETRSKQLISPIKENAEKPSRKEVAKSAPNIPSSDSDEVLMLPDSSDSKKMSRNSRRKTIRGIAREYSVARRRLSQSAEAKNNSALLRRQSTKLWGRKVIELTSKDMKYDYISKLKNNKGEIKQFAWIKGELIGKGTYGKVFLALNVTTGEMMAVKQVDIPRTGYANKEMRDIIDALHLEVQTMKDLDHPNIVQYLGFEKVGNTYSLFLDYVAGGSVGSCLRMYGRFEEDLIRFLTRQVIDGLSYLHSRGILHRDLKADNLLLDLDGVCKITDFGISKRSENIYKNDSEMSMQGTIFWMAPEVIDNVVQNKKQGYSAKIDIWSLGCVVLEMFAGRRPWSNVEALSAMYRIGKTKLAPPIPDDIKPYVSGDGKQFLSSCFEIDPNKRPTALELFKQSKFCNTREQFDFKRTKLATLIRDNDKPKEFGRR